MISISRPEPDEAAPFYHGYIAKVPEGHLVDQLTQQIRDVEQWLQNVSDQEALTRYAEGKWSVKEVLGHLCDVERIFTYRLLRIARGDATQLPGFDEKAYVPAGKFDQRPLSSLLAEFRTVRLSTIALIESLPGDAWSRWGEANESPITARALAYIIVGHVAHHLGVLRTRYALSAMRSSPSPA
jgi:uncharacterized damage-inducible protein DinB